MLGAAGLSSQVIALPSRIQSSGYFNLHPSIEEHPEAVFIMRTSVDHKMNAEAKKEAGLSFGRSVFVPSGESGIPLNISVPVKPNLKTANPLTNPLEDVLGTVADPFFVEGALTGLIELGMAGRQFHIREVNRPHWYGVPYGYSAMADRIDADIRLDQDTRFGSGLSEGKDFNWTEVPDGMWYKKIPHLEPVNAPDTWLLNIAKFKGHAMGLTLCCKNVQGTVAHNYQAFCTPITNNMDMLSTHIQDNATANIQASYERHKNEGIIPRWDKPGSSGASRMEIWTARTLDNLSVTPAGLHIIEGVYGRDGDSGNGGPHDGKANDFMSNVVIFGKDPFRVDNIGLWLGGHEPGNFGFFHIAIEKGMSTALDPNKIPVYLWDNGSATLTPLQNFERTPLMSEYLTKNYNGGTESKWHLVNEPFDYGLATGVEEPSTPEKPEAFVLYQNHPNPFNPYTSIEYRLPVGGYIRIEIFDITGQLITKLVDGYRHTGTHMAVWNTDSHSSGTYFYRLSFRGFSETRKMVLLR